MKKVACFITSGFTECGAMTAFLHKINPNCQYVQCFPNKPKYKRGLAPEYNGFTGESLLSEMYRRLKISKERGENFDVILIEDDLDGRFNKYSDQEILEYQQNVYHKVKEIGFSAPIIFLFASPEIEAWFLSDWDHTFKEVYKSIPSHPLKKNDNEYFCNRLKKYIDAEILQEHKNYIEQYGYDESGKYTKLSDEIQKAVSIGVKEIIKSDTTVNDKLKELIIENRELFYSKQLHGDTMLRNASPNTIASKCTIYFLKAHNQLKEIK